MTFVQLIEYKTEHPEQMNDMMDRWLAETRGKRTATHAVLMSDREHPGTYVEFVEFPSYEDAMRNSSLPETDRFAKEMMALCEGDPVFHNLEVMRDERL